MAANDVKRIDTTRTLGIGFLCVGVLLAAGCEGGHHGKGEQRISVAGSYGEPTTSTTLWPAAEGTGQNAAVTVEYDYFAADRIAVVGALTPYRNYNQSDHDVYAGEFQLGVRYYFWETELGKLPISFYGEVLGGLTYGAYSVPEEGSNFNFTQDTGVGLELHLTDDVSVFSGYRLKHLSNGDLFNDDNPAQNDHFVYAGVSFRLGS